MRITVLPIVERELRVASRRGATYWGRSGAALITLVLAMWFLLLQRSVQLGQVGKPLFLTLSFLAFLFAAFAGVTYSADSVSSEKRDGTLGLLFLTDLRGHDVTLGKLAASSLGSIYSLLAALPVLALALLMGGVTAGEYWRMVLLLVNTLMLSLCLGLLMSVLNSDSKRAAVATFIAVVAALLLLPALGALAGVGLRRLGYPPEVIDAWTKMTVNWMTPIMAYGNVFDAEFKTGATEYWCSQGYTAVLAWLCLAYASWRLPRSWQQGATESGRGGFRARLERMRFPTRERRDAFRAQLLEASPVAWLAGRHWLRPLVVWSFLLLCTGVFLVLAWQVGRDWWNGGVYLTTSILLHLVLKVWVANESSRQIVDDRSSGALELLLSTPLSVPEILRGLIVPLRRQFGAPIIAVLVADAAFLLASVSKDMSSSDDANMWTIFWLLRMCFLVFDCITLVWLGLWLGMTSKGTRTGSGAVTRVLIVPSLLFLGLMTLGLLPLLRGGDHFTPFLVLIAWAVIGTGNNVIWLRQARSRLLGEFRELATVRAAKKRGWFRFGGSAGAQ